MDESGEAALAVAVEGGDGDLGGEVSAVAAMADGFGDAGGEEGGDAIDCVEDVDHVDEGGERSADELGDAPAEDLAGGLVGEDDLHGLVDDEHGVGGGLGDDAAILIALAAGLVGALLGADEAADEQRGTDEDGEAKIERGGGRGARKDGERAESRGSEGDGEQPGSGAGVEAADHDGDQQAGGTCAGQPRDAESAQAYDRGQGVAFHA
jgi:hypothetical protein